jgi:hypothetical protein
MKKLKLFIFFLCISGVFLNLNAQGIIDEKKELSPSFYDSQQQLNYFSRQTNEPLGLDEINVSNSGVFINQIGDNNTSNVATQSSVSAIQLNQFGNSNQIELQLKAEVIDYNVTQNGNSNLLLEYNMFNDKQLLQRTVQQNGNNQNLVIHGRNSIVDKMKITMDKGSQSLIIRNTN